MNAGAIETNAAGHAATRHGPGHIVPVWLLAAVLGGLLVLTFITVAVTHVDLGKLNLWIAMAIATAKGFLVALYFMHLRWDRLFHGVVFMAALVFVLLFVGIVLMDTEAYQPELIPGYAPGMTQAATAGAEQSPGTTP
jgi:cytochrome c oxidase subunit 4